MESNGHMVNGVGEGVEENVDLVFEDENKETRWSSLNKLRKARQLCDQILVIGAHEIAVHRAVLATASGYLFDLFLKLEEEGPTPQNGMCTYKLKDIDYDSFIYLLDYAYTSRLEVPGEHVRSVYRAAIQLKMPDAARACSKFLAANMSSANCIGIRKIAKEAELKQTADDFIRNNINEVTANKHFYGLPRVPVVIIGADPELVESSDDRHMFNLVLSWAKENIDQEHPHLEYLTEQTNILYLNSDNTLTDTKDISDDRRKDDLVRVYTQKTKNRKNITPSKETGKNIQVSPGGTVVRKFSIHPDGLVTEKEWSIIATYQLKDKTYLAIAMLNGTLATISIHYHTGKSNSGSGSDEPDSPDSVTPKLPVMPDSLFERHASLTPLANMGSARCGFGICVTGDRIIACGGYDTGECLMSVETYDIKTNKWTPCADMPDPRGRFSMEQIDNVLYAIGGSNGHGSQTKIHCFDVATEKWKTLCNTNNARVSQGVIAVKDTLYLVGGCMGQQSLANCLVFKPHTQEWASLPPMNTPRYQAGVCHHQGELYAVGGTDGWNCLNSVEIFNFDTMTWRNGPKLNVARRGAGCVSFDGKVYIVGGSDGTQSLKSTEVFCPEKDAWMMGPGLSVPRANVAVVIYTNRVFAVGGFSGRTFLDTMEYLDPDNNEWCSYLSVEDSGLTQKLGERMCSKSTAQASGSQDNDHVSNNSKGD
ncbi:influenza virus NS1A-binding protein homolog A-like [Ylistrum balloti]|uniref:influenza virus NS1A-binding protein homolog A-like n=1 Tax=Ylistrum balloti TaxID=509963 RepID=UPI002905AC61|nr:influenza virus NS1A-binding protein homolog A-like [Ylistrum balloti]XP_060071167.1 influenza virus NS1A-binding protein homolog A-like [Ylistrum balloti]